MRIDPSKASWTNLSRATVAPGDNWPATCEGGDVVFASCRNYGAAGASSRSLNGRDVYGARADLYMMDRDGSNQRRLTVSPTSDFQPALSPDGSQIAFTRVGTGHTEIFVVNRDGTNLRQLVSMAGENQYPKWSPDGSKVSFLNVGSEKEFRVWPPSFRKEVYRICAVPADGGDPTVLLSNQGDASFKLLFPSWGPQGRILFSREGTESGLYVMDQDGGNAHRIISDDARLCACWSPDGQHIVYQRSHSDWSGDVWMVNSDGSEPQLLLPRNAGLRDPGLDVDRNGNLLLLSHASGIADVWRVDFNNGQPTTPATASDDTTSRPDSVWMKKSLTPEEKRRLARQLLEEADTDAAAAGSGTVQSEAGGLRVNGVFVPRKADQSSQEVTSS